MNQTVGQFNDTTVFATDVLIVACFGNNINALDVFIFRDRVVSMNIAYTTIKTDDDTEETKEGDSKLGVAMRALTQFSTLIPEEDDMSRTIQV